MAHGDEIVEVQDTRVPALGLGTCLLTDEERAQIDALPKDVRTANPPWAPDRDA